MDEVTGEWRKLHNEELHYVYYSVNQTNDEETEWGAACKGEKRNANKGLMVKPEGKRTFERSKP
jgi:hypothetical protein